MSRHRRKARIWTQAIRSAWDDQPRLFGLLLFGLAFGVIGGVQGDLLFALFGWVTFLVGVGLIWFGRTRSAR